MFQFHSLSSLSGLGFSIRLEGLTYFHHTTSMILLTTEKNSTASLQQPKDIEEPKVAGVVTCQSLGGGSILGGFLEYEETWALGGGNILGGFW